MPRRRRSGATARRGVREGEGNTYRERPHQRNAANARERARMRVLSRAFCRLKTTLPWVPPDTKLSKLDTLRLATSYIAHLVSVLANENAAESVHPLNLTENVNGTLPSITDITLEDIIDLEIPDLSEHYIELDFSDIDMAFHLSPRSATASPTHELEEHQ